MTPHLVCPPQATEKYAELRLVRFSISIKKGDL